MIRSADWNAKQRMEQMLQPTYPLRREDVIWMLEHIKKKVADKDPALLNLSQPRLLLNFRYFAEIAMSMIHPHASTEQETERLKNWMKEATYGFLSDPIEWE